MLKIALQSATVEPLSPNAFMRSLKETFLIQSLKDGTLTLSYRLLVLTL